MKKMWAIVALIVLALVVAFFFKKKKEQKPVLQSWTGGYEFKTYPTRELAGAKFGDILVDYTGISGRVPEEVRLSFCKNLSLMWEKKQKRSKRNGVVRDVSKAVVGTYCSAQPSSMTIKDYEEIVGDIVEQAYDDLDWDQVARIERLNRRRLNLVRNIAGSLRGKDFIAYAMTELMPTRDGKFNLAVFEFMLRNGGREYIESIPALFDPYVSFGPYQFTQYAWYDVGAEKRGGSRLNSALANPVKHGSVAELRGDEHHIAAFLFAVDNLSMLVRGLNEKQLTTLERSWKKRHGEVVQFIATAHNYPYGRFGAEGAAHRWLQNGARTSYIVSCSRKPRGYAIKTQANLNALR